MGLSIYCSGQLADALFLPKLIEEVTDIAVIEKWSSFVFDEQFANNSFSVTILLDEIETRISLIKTNSEDNRA